MTAFDNHYGFLGLQPSVSNEVIEAAIEHLSEQAVSLVYTSPERSSDLWERIRRMRRDLLATPEGRQVYDEALLRHQDMAADGQRGSTITSQVFRPRGEGTRSPVPAPAPVQTVRASAANVVDEPSRTIAWPYALVAAAAVFALVVGALLQHDPGISPTRRPVAMALSQLGAVHGSKFESGRKVTLTWTTVPGALAYRIQIVTAPGDPSDAVAFARGSRSVMVGAPPYQLKVTGQQLYYWRVRALVGSRWRRYTHSSHFAVAKPRIAEPVVLAPVTGIGRGGKRARLCWARVRAATGYRLKIQGQQTRTVHGTCTTLTVRPRTYHWSVAALVKGVQIYTGTYSVAAELHVPAVHHKATKTRTHRHSGAHGQIRHSRSRSGVSRGKHHAPPKAVEVASTLPRTTISSSNRTAARSVHKLSHSPSRKITRTVRAVSRTHGTHSGTSHRASKAHSIRVSLPVAHPVTAVRTTSHASVSNVDASPAKQATPVSVTRTSPARSPTPVSVTRASPIYPTPAKPHTPVVASQLPAPPAPPPPPAQAAATSAPLPTRSVSTSRAATPASPIYIRPIVAQAPATTVPLATAKPTASAAIPAVRPPAPIATSTRAPAPTPPSVQAPTVQHSQHPDHPPHPVHPAHP